MHIRCRHLLIGADITDHFRMMAFDMPRLEKSSPPDGFEADDYRFTIKESNADVASPMIEELA